MGVERDWQMCALRELDNRHQPEVHDDRFVPGMKNGRHDCGHQEEELMAMRELIHVLFRVEEALVEGSKCTLALLTMMGIPILLNTGIVHLQSLAYQTHALMKYCHF